MISRDVDYNFPEAAYFILAALVWVILFYLLHRYRESVLQRFFNPQLLAQIMEPRSKAMTWIKNGSLILAWVFGCLALMEPRAHSRYIHTESETTQVKGTNPPRTLLFLIDASESMRVKDTRLGISRFDDAKEISQAILEQMGSVNAGVFAFTSNFTQLSPPSPDQLFTRLMIKSIRINEGDEAGSNLLKPLQTLKERFLTSPSDMQYSVILISDGGDNNLEITQGSQHQNLRAEIVNVLSPSPGVHFRVYTIGTGTTAGGNIPDFTYQGHPVHSSLDENLMKDIAKTGQGKFYLANAFTPLSLAQDLSREIIQTPYSPSAVMEPESAESAESSLVYDLYFQIPLGFSLFFLALGLLWPETSRKKGEVRD